MAILSRVNIKRRAKDIYREVDAGTGRLEDDATGAATVGIGATAAGPGPDGGGFPSRNIATADWAEVPSEASRITTSSAGSAELSRRVK